MHGKVGEHRERLSAELIACRSEARRVSQDDLALLAGVNRNTISDIERQLTLPKAPTLRKIARGLATYAPGRTDEELATEYYDRLMRAAGYLEDRSGSLQADAVRPEGEVMEDVQDFLRKNVGEGATVALLEVAKDGGLSEEGQETLARLLRMMRRGSRANDPG